MSDIDLVSEFPGDWFWSFDNCDLDSSGNYKINLHFDVKDQRVICELVFDEVFTIACANESFCYQRYEKAQSDGCGMLNELSDSSLLKEFHIATAEFYDVLKTRHYMLLAENDMIDVIAMKRPSLKMIAPDSIKGDLLEVTENLKFLNCEIAS